MIFFAESVVPPDGYQVFLSCVMYTVVSIVSLGAAYKLFWGKREANPQPFVVTAKPSYADAEKTEARFQHIETKIEEARKENKTDMDILRKEGQEGRARIYTKIDAIPREIFLLLRDSKEIHK